MAKSILLVDDSPDVRSRIRTLLEHESGLRVCGEAADGIEAIEQAMRLVPDLIVMDLSMPRMNGLEATRKLRDEMPRVPIILFTLHKSILEASVAIAAGVSAVVSKAEDQELLKTEILHQLAMA